MYLTCIFLLVYENTHFYFTWYIPLRSERSNKKEKEKKEVKGQHHRVRTTSDSGRLPSNFPNGCTNLHSTQESTRILVVLYPCQHQVLSNLFFRCSIGCTGYHPVILMYVSLLLSWVPFHVIICHLDLLFYEVTIQVFYVFYTSSIVFSLLTCRYYRY